MAIIHSLRFDAKSVLLLACLVGLTGHTPVWAGALTATDASGNTVRIDGTIVVVEPDIELTLVTAGGVQEPRREWSDTARQLYPQLVRDKFTKAGVHIVPDYELADELAPQSRIGQVIRLNEAVSQSIAFYSQPNSRLATKGSKLDWTLGSGVRDLQQATGADYGLFTYIRDSYASGGRTAMRVLAMLAGAAVGQAVDIGGGIQVGVANLVDLRSGQVVWFNLLARETGDLRTREGAEDTVEDLLKGLPL